MNENAIRAMQVENDRLHRRIAALSRMIPAENNAESTGKTWKSPLEESALPDENLLNCLRLFREIHGEVPFESNTNYWHVNLYSEKQVEAFFPLHQVLHKINPQWSRWESAEDQARKIGYHGTLEEWIQVIRKLVSWHLALAAIISVYDIEREG